MTVIDEIAAERQRQIIAEGYSTVHDDEHVRGEIADAAAAYAVDGRWPLDGIVLRLWPWDEESFRPRDARRNLIKAAALLVAEIERLDRASERRLAIIAAKARVDLGGNPLK